MKLVITVAEPVLRVRDFTVEFWVDGVWYPAAVDMNFDVEAGKVTAIVGESGSGKSTTAMGLMSLLASNARSHGSVKIKGEEMIGAPTSLLRKFRGKEVAYIFQEPASSLNPVFRVEEQIAALREQLNDETAQLESFIASEALDQANEASAQLRLEQKRGDG